MSGRDPKFVANEEEQIIERSRLLIEELDALIRRAKEIAEEHKALRESFDESRKGRK